MRKQFIEILPFFLVALVCVLGVEWLYGSLVDKLTLPLELADPVGRDGLESDMEATGMSSNDDRKVVLVRNLFHSVLDDPTKRPGKEVLIPVQEKLEETTLKVILLGTVADNGGNGRAIIYDKISKKQDLFLVGDQVQGAELKKIMRGRVLLRYNGKDEILDMSHSGDYIPPAVVSRSRRNRKLSQRPERSPEIKQLQEEKRRLKRRRPPEMDQDL